jgi:Na+/proline symporter
MSEDMGFLARFGDVYDQGRDAVPGDKAHVRVVQYSAGRTVKTGLTAAATVSAWTWAATLLQSSSSVAYQYGISGPFWYAAGASIQVLLFGILAIDLKRNAPNSHTFLEIIRARYGDGAPRRARMHVYHSAGAAVYSIINT